MTSNVEELLQDLYHGPLDDFVKRRTAAARSLREAGDREAAARVAKLRKPRLAAWAVDRLAVLEPALLQELVKLTAEASAANDAAALRTGLARRRELVEQLVGAAGHALEDAGHDAGDATLRQVADTLLAASVELPDELQAGTLAEPLSGGSFVGLPGLAAGAVDSSDGTPARARARSGGNGSGSANGATQEHEQEQARARERAMQREKLERLLERERRKLDGRRGKVERARERATAAARRLQEEEQALERSQDRHDELASRIERFDHDEPV